MMASPENVTVGHPGMSGTSAATSMASSSHDRSEEDQHQQNQHNQQRRGQMIRGGGGGSGGLSSHDGGGDGSTAAAETLADCNTGWTIGAASPEVGATPASASVSASASPTGDSNFADSSASSSSLAEAMADVGDAKSAGEVHAGRQATLTSLSAAVLRPFAASGTISRRGSLSGSAGSRGGGRTPPPQTTSPDQFPPSVYRDRLFRHPNMTGIESVLSATCSTVGFDIAELWLRTGPKTHQLLSSYLSPPGSTGSATQHDERFHAELVDVYYGERSAERTHRLSPALCRRARDANDVVWVTANTEHGADALRCAISDVRTAVAVPVCHEVTGTNITVIYFSVRRAMMRPPAVEFLVHMSLAAALAAVNAFAEEIFVDMPTGRNDSSSSRSGGNGSSQMSRSEHVSSHQHQQHPHHHRPRTHVSIRGARLDMRWANLSNVEYLTDGGNNWIHTAVVAGRPVVVKTLKPECQDVALAINEIEGELEIHSKLSHENIVELVGAGTTSKGNRFVVLERLDGGTLTQVLGYDTRIRDRRRRFWKRKHMAYVEVLTHARSLADALAYCQGRAIPGCMCLHRDLKPDNIGFTLDGTLKLLDFGLARIVENSSPYSDEVYHMSGETGSLRYMAPEVADSRPYNHKADVYSFGIILWELLANKKPYDGMNRETFYVRVVKGDERPPLSKKWPKDISKLLMECWSADMHNRPNFDEVVERLDVMLAAQKGGGKKAKGIAALIDRHSTWF